MKSDICIACAVFGWVSGVILAFAVIGFGMGLATGEVALHWPGLGVFAVAGVLAGAGAWMVERVLRRRAGRY